MKEIAPPSAREILCENLITPIERYIQDRHEITRYLRREMRNLTDEQKRILFLRLDREFAKKDPYYFATEHCVTLDQHAVAQNLDPVRPVPKLRFVWLTLHIMRMFRVKISAKSRQLLRTWLATLFQCWNCNSHPGKQVYYRSITEAMAGFGSADKYNVDVNCMLGRHFFTHMRLPPHIQQPFTRYNKLPAHLDIHHFNPKTRTSLTSSIHAISGSTSSIAGKTATDIVHDEVSKQRDAGQFIGIALPALGRYGSYDGIFTPMRREVGWQMLTGEDPSDTDRLRKYDEAPFEEIMPIKDEHGPGGRIRGLFSGAVLNQIFEDETEIPLGPRYLVRVNRDGSLATRLYWRADPMKDKGFYRDVIAKMPAWAIRREFEIDPTADEDYHPVWEIEPKIHLDSNLEPDPDYPIDRIWDFGGHAAVLFAQAVPQEYPVPHVEVRFLGETDCIGLELKAFAVRVLSDGERFFGKGRYRFVDIADVAGKQRSSQTAMTHIEAVRKSVGINISRARKIERPEGISLLHAKIQERLPDGRPTFRINPLRCAVFANAMQGHVALDDEGGLLDNATTDWFIHLADVAKYWTVHRLRWKDLLTDSGTATEPPPQKLTDEQLGEAWDKYKMEKMRKRADDIMTRRRNRQTSRARSILED